MLMAHLHLKDILHYPLEHFDTILTTKDMESSDKSQKKVAVNYRLIYKSGIIAKYKITKYYVIRFFTYAVL